MIDNIQAPWIGNDDYGRDSEYDRFDYEYDNQDDERDRRYWPNYACDEEDK